MSRDFRCLGVEFTSHGTVEAPHLSGNFNFSLLGGRSVQEGSSAKMELKEISLSLRIKGDSHHLSSSRDNASSVPLSRFVRSNRAENVSPSGVGEFEVESTGDRLFSSALVTGLVHPHICNIAINLLSRALANVLRFASAFSTGNSFVFTVGEFHGHGTPDGTVRDFLLVARFDHSGLTVLSSSYGSHDGSAREVLSSHDSVETSILFDNWCSASSRHGCNCTTEFTLSTKSSLAHVETHEVSLALHVISQTVKLSTSSENF